MSREWTAKQSRPARAFGVLLLGLGARAWSGCTVATAETFVAPRCENDSACEPANEALGLGPEACTRYRCAAATARCVLTPRDQDGDGVVARECGGDDCDDGASDAYGGATPASERCDGRDTNCDGRLDGIDEDDDGDGHADSACAGAAGSDCNDRDPAVWVGAPERCDGRDNDCSSGGGLDRTEDRSCPTTAGWACRAGRCEDDRCGAGRLNCDRDDANSCEVDARTSAAHCGRCGAACTGAGAACIEGRCDAVTQVAVGDGLACALRSSGTVACWGHAIDLVPEDGFVEGVAAPTVMPWARGARHLFAGRRACAIEATGGVLCWGGRLEYDFLETGRPGAYDRLSRFAMPSEPRALASGVSLWVADAAGALRARSYVDGAAADPLEGAANIISAAVSTGYVFHGCLATRDGATRCWGSNDHGELGSDIEGSHSAVLVPGVSGVVSVATGAEHSCALRGDGVVYCWGSNAQGQVSPDPALRGPAPRLPTMVTVASGRPVQLAAGGATTCVRTEERRVLCWGARTGSLASAGGALRPVVGIDDATDVSVGVDEVCVVRANRGVWCWGGAAQGTGADATFSALPHPVAGL